MITIKQEDTTVNLSLAEKQGLCDVNVNKIHQLHIDRDNITGQMEATDSKDIDTLKGLLKQYRKVERELKKQWKFPLTKKYDKEYRLPHCTCPKMDNDDDYYGYNELRWINQGCPYHGK